MDYASSRLNTFKFSLRSIILTILFSAVFYELSFSSQVFALYTPTLSASVDNTAASVNGNQVINTTYKTTEIYLNLTVNTNNKTGYAVTLNSETDETALVNSDSANGAKINSISTSLPLNNLPNNSWGYKLASATNYVPIPALSTPAQILQTAGETSGNETNGMKIGLKLSDNLESGRYTNKLIFSILTNNYDRIALMTNGPIFNTKLKSLETATNKIERFKKSAVAPAASMNAVNVEDVDSDYEIKLWLDPTDKTAYYYAEPEKVYLNTNSSKMFYSASYEQGIKNILEIDLSNFDTSMVMDMSNMFYSMSKLTTLNLSNFDTSMVMDMSNMFIGMSNLTSLNLSSFNTSHVMYMKAMFAGLSNIITLDLSNFDTSKVTNMISMFSGTSNLTTLNLSNFNTSQVTIMGGMFYGMSNLTTLNLSNFNTSKTTDMRSMFNGMTNLASLNISSFNTENVENMSSMFSQAQKIEHLDLSHFRTDKVTNMGSMFYQMSALKNINLSHFNTANVTDMSSMFSMDDNLTELDLRSFTTSKVENFGYMFASFTTDNRLTRIYTSGDWDTSRAIAAGISAPRNVLIFANRVNLVGNNGWTSATPNNVGLEALRIDRHLAPGYFTLRS